MDINNLSGAEAHEIASNEQNEYYSALRDESHPSHGFIKSRVEAAFQRADPERDQRIKNDHQADAWAAGPRVRPSDVKASEEADRAEVIDRGGVPATDTGEISLALQNEMMTDLGMNHEQFTPALASLKTWMGEQCSTPEKADAFAELVEQAEQKLGRAGALKLALQLAKKR